jgi:hypothetical protein
MAATVPGLRGLVAAEPSRAAGRDSMNRRTIRWLRELASLALVERT